MNKDSAPEELIRAIHKVLAGGRYVSPALAEKLVLDLNEDAARPPHESLSDREFEVLCLMATGKTVSQIAEELHLSLTTISTYRARILEKMNMNTSAELIHYAVRNDLVE
jgi:DNA-binding NarL/FixJ family response regulator